MFNKKNTLSKMASRPEDDWAPLKRFRCPAKDCPDKETEHTWVCTKHRLQMYISQKGYMRCERTDHMYKIIDWRWDCGKHDEGHHIDTYREADFEGFTFALSHAVQFMTVKGGNWVGQLCVELGKQFGRE